MTKSESVVTRPIAKAATVLCSVVPLVVAVLVLQLIDPQSPPILIAGTTAFVPGLITYAALVTVHLFACAGALILALLVLRSSADRRWFTAVAALLAVGTSLLLVFGGSQHVAAFRFTYQFFATMFAGHALTHSLVGTVGITPLIIAAALPTITGVCAVSFIAAAAASQLWRLYDERDFELERERQICGAHDRIRQCAYFLSLVLVTSTVSASFFFRLPVDLFGAKTDAGMTVDRLATELSLFWAGVYSLTLMAAIGLPLLLVQSEVRRFLSGLKPPEDDHARQRFASVGALMGGHDQVKMLVAFLAPFVSGPVAGLVHSVIGG
jgi:hypothetical protein